MALPPSLGYGRGILVGFDECVAEVLSWQNKQFTVSAIVKNVVDECTWRLVVVYGSPYEEGKDEFINELHDLLTNWSGPTVIGGDFNLVCNQSEKSNGVINHHWSNLFNDWINTWGLVELKNSTRSFSWSNNQNQPIMAAIDKIFCSTEFSQNYLLSYVTTASRAGSDHVPLVLNFGLNQEKKHTNFRFEKWWLEREDFHDLVRSLWKIPCSFNNPLDTWQFKIRKLRKKAKGWALNVNAEIRKTKSKLMEEYDKLDLLQESTQLDDSDRQRMKNILEELSSI